MSSPTKTRFAAAFLLSGIAIAWTGAAHAVECKTDADCPSGFQCEKGVSVPGCAGGQDCPDAAPIVEETGYCEKAPISCQADTDCPQFMKCSASASDSPCWIDSTGDGGCAEPDPNPPKYCAYAPIACTADGECPEGFACTEETDCAVAPCPAGQECPVPPDCQSSKFCGPKEISCQADSECPKDWTCVEMYEPCAVDSTSPAPGAAGAAGAAAEDLPCENTVSKKLCSPPGFPGVGDYKESAAQDTSGTTNTGSSPAPEDSGGGCQLASGPASSGLAGAWLMAAAALIPFRRRRSR